MVDEEDEGDGGASGTRSLYSLFAAMMEFNRFLKSQNLIRIEHMGTHLHIRGLHLDSTLETYAVFENMIR